MIPPRAPSSPSPAVLLPPRLSFQKCNAATRQHGLSYSRFQFALRQENIQLDRKILADLAVTEPLSFSALTRHATSVAADHLQQVAANVANTTPSAREDAWKDHQMRKLRQENVLTPEQRKFLRQLATGGARNSDE